MKTPIRSLSSAALVTALAACSSMHSAVVTQMDAGGGQDGNSSPDGSPSMDVGGGDGSPSSITYWLAPNGSEVVLKLDPVEPTTGF